MGIPGRVWRMILVAVRAQGRSLRPSTSTTSTASIRRRDSSALAAVLRSWFSSDRKSGTGLAGETRRIELTVTSQSCASPYRIRGNGMALPWPA